MKFVEAVNLIEKKYGAQAFDHLENYAEDEAAQIILRERERGTQSRRRRNMQEARIQDRKYFVKWWRTGTAMRKLWR